jgi:thiamine-phosphate pyrophosphorylase
MFSRGIYAITPTGWQIDRLLMAVDELLQAGVVVVQYRDKDRSFLEKVKAAREIVALCKQYGVPCIINDDVMLAMQVNADGVHIGRDDALLERVRSEWGEKKIVGVTCYGELDRARSAVQGGANYVAFGSLFSSVTKPHAPTIGISQFQVLSQQVILPVVAIGGINASNVEGVWSAGAHSVAVINAIFEAKDKAMAVSTLKNGFFN